MSERRDDTTEPGERGDGPRPAHERAPHSYYYDDGTGYVVYDPAEDDDETDAGGAGKAAGEGAEVRRG